MMDSGVIDWLRDVLAGHTDEAHIVECLDGWRRYFARLNIEEPHQKAEFDAVMRMRAACGSISVIADDVDEVLWVSPLQRWRAKLSGDAVPGGPRGEG
jgi:hypothetical protein